MSVSEIGKSLLLGLANRSGLVWRAAHFVAENATSPEALRANAYSYPGLRRQFIANGERSKYDVAVRRELVRRFERIDRSVKKASSASDGLFLAEAFLALDGEGDAVECGCFEGASTAKLSILAALTGRRLFVFDSFEGLPETDDREASDLHMRHGGTPRWWGGRYAGALERVRANVEAHGEISVCSFVKGWFQDTLTAANLPERVVLAFVDVDLPSSVTQCVRALWPRIPTGGVLFSHDVAFVAVMQALQDPELWRSVSEPAPPLLFGGGFGLCNESPHLGYFVKGAHALPAEYLKGLTIHR